MKFTVYRTLFKREWRWRLRARNGKIIADSGEGYRNLQDCMHGVVLIMNGVADAACEIKHPDPLNVG